MVGGAAGPGTYPVDLHLTSTSPAIDAGMTAPAVMDLVSGVKSITIPGTLGTVYLRHDTIYDIDFGVRLNGYNVDVGADEFHGLVNGMPAPTRNATLVPTVGTPLGGDLDILGNLVPNSIGLWFTHVEVQGTPGDTVFLYSCEGFSNTAVSSTVAVVERRTG